MTLINVLEDYQPADQPKSSEKKAKYIPPVVDQEPVETVSLVQGDAESEDNGDSDASGSGLPDFSGFELKDDE